MLSISRCAQLVILTAVILVCSAAPARASCADCDTLAGEMYPGCNVCGNPLFSSLGCESCPVCLSGGSCAGDDSPEMDGYAPLAAAALAAAGLLVSRFLMRRRKASPQTGSGQAAR